MLKLYSSVKARLLALCALLMSFGIVLPSFAAEPDYTALTGGVVVTNLIAALFAVAVVMVGLYLAKRGIEMVLTMLNRGK